MKETMDRRNFFMLLGVIPIIATGKMEKIKSVGDIPEGYVHVTCSKCGGFLSKLSKDLLDKKIRRAWHADFFAKTGDFFISICLPCFLQPMASKLALEFKKNYMKEFNCIYGVNIGKAFNGEQKKGGVDMGGISMDFLSSGSLTGFTASVMDDGSIDFSNVPSMSI